MREKQILKMKCWDGDRGHERLVVDDLHDGVWKMHEVHGEIFRQVATARDAQAARKRLFFVAGTLFFEIQITGGPIDRNEIHFSAVVATEKVGPRRRGGITRG